MPLDDSKPGFRLDLSDERLWDGNTVVPLSRKPFSMLRYFVEHPNRLLTKEAILEQVWPNTWVTEGSVKDYVQDIRRALGDDPGQPRFIETVRGRGYRYLGGIEVLRTTAKQCFQASGHASPPSVVVLPLAYTRGDPKQENLANGVAEDLGIELSRFHSLRVIAASPSIAYGKQSVDSRALGRRLGAHYLLRGSVRIADNQARFTAQLLEAATGECLWAERYDRDLTNVHLLQTEIARTVASALVGRLRTATQDRAARKLAEDMDAYDYVLMGEGIIANSKANNHRARQAFQRALALDPNCATAYAGLAHSHAIDGVFRYGDSYECSLDQALSYAVKGVVLDNANCKAEWVLGHVLDLRGESEHARPHFDRALELNPIDADAHCMKAIFLTHAGNPEASITSHKTAMRLNPFRPGWYIWNLGNAYYATKRYDQALITTKTFTDRHPRFMRPRRSLAAIYARLGRMEEAQAVVEEILACEPDASLGQEHALHSRRFKKPRDLEHWLEGFRKAGLPE